MDPSMLSGMSEMFKNPDMMKSMEEMMKNPELINNAMNMMNDPSMKNLFGGLGNMGNTESSANDEKSQDNVESNDGSVEVDNEEIYEFSEGDFVFINGLKNDTYNNKNGVVQCYNSSTGRYNVFIESLDKTIALKPDNILATPVNVSVEEVD